MTKGVLYVVATPIGNLEDFSQRAAETLRQVDLIAAEDTRHTRLLLRHYAIDTPMRSLHEHNERVQMEPLIERLLTGHSIALVSDAGTPLISDPGFPLVRQVAAQGIRVVPIPGPSALICALSAAGLPTDRFLFAGFPPRNSGQRKQWFEALAPTQATLIFYESSHRILASLQEMLTHFGAEREVVIAREMSKFHETFLRGNLVGLIDAVAGDENQQKGEFVVLVAAANPDGEARVEIDVERLLRRLLLELPLKKAVALTAEVTGSKKNRLYEQALKIKEESM